MHEIIIPKLGLDTLECDIQEWLVNVGDKVEEGKPILEVEKLNVRYQTKDGEIHAVEDVSFKVFSNEVFVFA